VTALGRPPYIRFRWGGHSALSGWGPARCYASWLPDYPARAKAARRESPTVQMETPISTKVLDQAWRPSTDYPA